MSDPKPYTREEWSRDPSEGRWHPTRVRLTVEALFAEVASLRALQRPLEAFVAQVDADEQSYLHDHEDDDGCRACDYLALRRDARAALAGRGPEARGECKGRHVLYEGACVEVGCGFRADAPPSPDVRGLLEALFFKVSQVDDWTPIGFIRRELDALAAARKERP